MKLITKATLVLICLSAMTILEVEASLLKRNKNKTLLCAKVYFPKIQNSELKAITDYGAVFPGDSQNKDKALENAKLQTTAARKFYYLIKSDQKASHVLRNVASNFRNFLISNVDNLVRIVNPANNVSRQANEGGTWSHFDSHVREVSAPILTENRQLTPQQLQDKIKEVTNKLKQYLTQEFTKTALHEIIDQRSGTNPKTLLGFLGLIGDIGAAVQDVIGRNRNNPDQHKDIMAVKDAMVAFFGDFTQLSKEWYNIYCPDIYYDKPNGRGKQKERATCSSKLDKKEENKSPRSGVLNVGETVDGQIRDPSWGKDNDGKDKKVPNEIQIPKISWPWQTVPKSLVDFCPDEPWAGHFSGSLYELILMLELFDRKAEAIKVTRTPTLEEKRIYAAIASSFLVATGMHSSVELVYVVKKYLGEKVDEIMDKPKVCQGASKYIADLIDGVMKITHGSSTPTPKAPETKATATKAPETKAPATKAPESKAPATKASETASKITTVKN